MTTGDVADNLAYCIVTSTDTKLAYVSPDSPVKGNMDSVGRNISLVRIFCQSSRFSDRLQSFVTSPAENPLEFTSLRQLQAIQRAH